MGAAPWGGIGFDGGEGVQKKLLDGGAPMMQMDMKIDM